MKTLYTALCTLAFINLLVGGGVLGWLISTDRLDKVRVHEVRQLFEETVTQRNAREAEAAAALERERAAEEERARESQAPIPAADIVAARLEHNQADTTRLEAIRREVQILQETLRRERNALEDEKAAFRREREEFENARRIVAQTEGSAQFRKALSTYEALKPDRARAAFGQLIAQGEIEQVVAYLNAMQERTRTRIIDDFLQDQPEVATDLLERLRTRGLAARVPESPPG